MLQEVAEEDGALCGSRRRVLRGNVDIHLSVPSCYRTALPLVGKFPVFGEMGLLMGKWGNGTCDGEIWVAAMQLTFLIVLSR